MKFIDRARRGVVDERRIGSGIGWMVAGVALLMFGVFAALGGGGSVATLVLSLAGLCVVIGFWTRLFGAIEQRLIEIQIAVLGDAAKTAADDPQASTERRDSAANYIG